MNDLEIAKHQLLEKDFSIVIAKDGKIVFETKQSGISGFLEAIEKFDRKRFHGSSVADKVVGRAAALLCVYCGAKAVYAIVLSRSGLEVLEENGVLVEFEGIVPNILNQPKTDICPFEKTVASTVNPKEAYEKLKSCKKEIKSVRR